MFTNEWTFNSQNYGKRSGHVDVTLQIIGQQSDLVSAVVVEWRIAHTFWTVKSNLSVIDKKQGGQSPSTSQKHCQDKCLKDVADNQVLQINSEIYACFSSRSENHCFQRTLSNHLKMMWRVRLWLNSQHEKVLNWLNKMMSMTLLEIILMVSKQGKQPALYPKRSSKACLSSC